MASSSVKIPVKKINAKAKAKASLKISTDKVKKAQSLKFKKKDQAEATKVLTKKITVNKKPQTSKDAPASKAKSVAKRTEKITKKIVAVTKSKVAKSVKKTKSLPKNPNPFPEIKRNPLGHLLVEELLRKNGFKGGVSAKKEVLQKYSTDESIFSIQPQLVLQPKNKNDIQIAVRVLAEEAGRFPALSLTPRAAGTGLSGGSLTDSIVIDVCAHMNSIDKVVVKKSGISFACEPGAMWRDVEKKLKRHGAYLPSYPSSKDLCSIGGAVANNAAGSDSLRYGHTADWVEELEVVLQDGKPYLIKALTFKEYQSLIKEKHEHARIAKEVFFLIEKNEKEIKKNKPKTSKNSAGFALWNVFSDGVAAFKKGQGTFDLTRLFSGSQGTIGIITYIKMRAVPIPADTTLIAVPVFDLLDSAKVIASALEYNPINIELFDGLSFDLALKNPDYFRQFLSGTDFYRVMFNLYTTYHLRYKKKTPEFTILITLDGETTHKHKPTAIAEAISTNKSKARVITSKSEAEMLWWVRRASYTLSKFQDKNKRPAAFLEDMTVPPEKLPKFFREIKKLLEEFGVTAAVHGHGGDGHLHFYPLIDFREKTAPELVEAMSEKFFSTAVKYGGNICGEHNDGIIRTPHLNKVFSKKMLDVFVKMENIFDANDIFNPGKKVNPRFDIKKVIRTEN